MSGAGRTGVQHGTGQAFDLARGRLIAAIAAGFGLATACGGLAEEGGPSSPEAASSGSQSSAPRSTTPTRPATSPGGRSPAMAATQTVPSRAGETCYSQTDAAAVPGLEVVLPLLPDDAFDDNGCLSSQYSAWVNGGGCLHDANAAVVRGDRCCYMMTVSDPGCGRPLIVEGSARVAPVAQNAVWLSGGLSKEAPGALAPFGAAEIVVPVPCGGVARRIAEEWLNDARLEHASIASFSAFALSLLAVGAPAELVAECHLAAADEVEHARACFGLASRFASTTLGPGPLSLAGLELIDDLEALTRRTWLDGCVEETIAALTAAAQLDVAQDEGARTALTRIARDEARHAELAWKFVAWALGRSDGSLRTALLQLGEDLATVSPARSAAVSNEDLAALHAAGRLSPLERQAIRERTLREVIQPGLSRLLAEV